jgi:hypothetical protein
MISKEEKSDIALMNALEISIIKLNFFHIFEGFLELRQLI